MFRQYRTIQPGEFILAFADTSAGMGDYCACVFLSHKNLDIPLIYHSKSLATEMTNAIHPVLEKISDVTKIKPVIAYERNNGGVFELERLSALNRLGKYRIYKMMTYGTIDNPDVTKLGWDTNTSTRPKMLSEWKEAVDKHLVAIYDKSTVEEHFSFILTPSSGSIKAKAETNAHDDLVMSCFIAGTRVLTDKGNKAIETIKVGDMVLTRNGYRPVVETHTQYKKVIYNRSLDLIGTPDHPVITKEGTVRLDATHVSDTIYIWNEKRSSIEEKSIIDIPPHRGDSYGFISGDMISGNIRLWRFIDKFGLTTSVIFLSDMLYTIRMGILSIMHHLISTLRRTDITAPNICLQRKEGISQLRMERDKRKDLSDNLESGKSAIQTHQRFIEKVLKSISYFLFPLKESALNVVHHLLTKINRALNIVVGYAGVGQTKEQENRGIGEKGVRKVYNLTVLDCPEYFANNILVHNCAGVWQLYQSEKPVKTAFDVKDFPDDTKFFRGGFY